MILPGKGSFCCITWKHVSRRIGFLLGRQHVRLQATAKPQRLEVADCKWRSTQSGQPLHPPSRRAADQAARPRPTKARAPSTCATGKRKIFGAAPLRLRICWNLEAPQTKPDIKQSSVQQHALGPQMSRALSACQPRVCHDRNTQTPEPEAQAASHLKSFLPKLKP